MIYLAVDKRLNGGLCSPHKYEMHSLTIRNSHFPLGRIRAPCCGLSLIAPLKVRTVT